MRKLRQLILLFVFINAGWANAQKQGQLLIDSLLGVLPAMKADTAKVKVLNSLCYEYARIDIDEGLKYGTEALALATKLNWKKGQANAHRFIGINYLNVSVIDTAFENLEKALKFYEEINEKEGIAKTYGSMGNLHNMQGDRAKALEFHLKALGINEDLKDERTIAANLNNIAVIYFELGREREAINMVTRAVSLNKKYNNKTFLAINHHELGRFYEFIKQYDSAFDHSKKAFEISSEIGDKNGTALGLEGMAFIEDYKKNYSRALELYNQAMALRIEMDDQLGEAGSLGNIAICYLNMSKEYADKKNALLDSSVAYCEKGITLAREINSMEWLKINYTTLAEARELQGKPALSLEAFKLSVAYKDSLFNADKKESIKNLEDKREIELRDKQLKINELEIDNRKRLQWLFVAGIGFLLLVGALLYRQNVHRKKSNLALQSLNTDLVEANETKTRFLGILNHDLRAPVANLIQFLTIQKEAPDLLDDETKNKMEAQTFAGAENLLQSMEDLLLWSKGQMQHFKPVMKQTAASDLFDNISKHFFSTQHLRFVFEDKENLLLNTDANFLLTIMRNLTGNAAKALLHTNNASIIWKAYTQNGQAILSITDNGPGIESSELKALYNEKEITGIKSGLGLHLIRDMAKAIDCNIDIKSEKGKGTEFTLQFNA